MVYKGQFGAKEARVNDDFAGGIPPALALALALNITPTHRPLINTSINANKILLLAY